MWEKLLDRFAEGQISVGNLEIQFPSGAKKSYGDGSGPKISVSIADTASLRQVVLRPEMGLGEAYMDGRLRIKGDDISGFLRLMVINIGQRGILWQRPFASLRHAARRFHQANPIYQARTNVAHHYDLSAGLYDLFLDADKQYSCAYFRNPDDTLETAQAQKKAHIAAKLRLEPGMRVLDIGCGWGGLALSLAKNHGVSVTGITLSKEQHKIAVARAADAGLEARVEFKICDYRKVTGTFDRVVSVGMFEHVGVPNYGDYFGLVRDKLTPDGIALIHTIGRRTPPGVTSPWITKYIFPGGYVPALSEVMQAVERNDLWSADIEVWRLHYAETLRHWHDRFVANAERAKAIYDERFYRMWRFYLIASELTFRESRQVVFQLQLSRKVDAVPITRDYLYADSRDSVSHAAE
ncbi:MAG: cyclopropane-fatty-acyl-phospholipid synthase family protein [Pseudomonadota bacterium]